MRREERGEWREKDGSFPLALLRVRMTRGRQAVTFAS
jgi:hypothetical protein